jgi:phospholysine phosphohistidine inorganic pyrophosphate phosphatase
MKLRGALLDIEGVLYQQGHAIPGARETLDWLRRRGIAVRFLTNVTMRPRAAIADRLGHAGLSLDVGEIFSAAMAAVAELRRSGIRRIHLAVRRELEEDFEGFLLGHDRVEAVVLGDLGEEFTWPRLNQIFQMLLDGARLVALQKNRYYRRAQGLSLDLGPFVCALEYAANVEASVVGKPTRSFFEMALSDMDVPPAEAIMVGDDLEADVEGARKAGVRAIQVETGKFRPPDRDSPIRPDTRIASIAELPDVIERL